MVVKELQDPSAFLSAAAPLLLEDEARNNLILGIAGTLSEHPSVYPEFRLWLVDDEQGRALGAALQTPPYNLVLGQPRNQGVLVALANALSTTTVELPGVVGAVPEVHTFSEMWVAQTGVVRRQRRAQRVYRLTTLRPVRDVSGFARTATEADRELLVSLVGAFAAEAMPNDAPDRGAERTVDARLRTGTGGFTIWEDGGPVSVAGWGGRTPNGVRVGPVYTPPEHRRHGYGSAVTAAVTAAQLAAGRTFCFLYTDLANPTSNKIYGDIGYEPVCDAIDYAFELESQAP
jgi:predicted GNAT family acetyltransferase